MNSYIFTGDELTVVLDNTPYTVSNDHPNFKRIIDCIKANDWSPIAGLISVAAALDSYVDGRVVVDEDAGVIRYNGQVLHNTMTDRIMWMMRDGFPIDPLIMFIENLMKNPSKRAIDELYTFLEYGKLPITEDGHFLAYKRVRDDYMDVHSGTCLNKPASLITIADRGLPYKTSNGVTVTVENGETTLSMERNRVQDDPNVTCSYGLHFCSLEYLKSFGGERIVIMKINPADVVSIPADYNNTKGRCCKYQVVGEYAGAMTDPAFKKSVVNSDGSDYEPEDLEEDTGNSYDEGYTDGIHDRNYDNGAAYGIEDLADAERHGDDKAPYIEGYLAGFANEDERLRALTGSVDQPQDYIEGYVKGHKAGRKREVEEVRPIDLERGGVWAVDGNEYAVGYVDGYKDGKGHKARRYTLD